MPSAVLVGILAVLLIVSLSAGIGGSAPRGVPPLTERVGTMLLLIGLAAGFLGGIIGTGGCSVMLPAIHFWLGCPAAIAVGT